MEGVVLIAAAGSWHFASLLALSYVVVPGRDVVLLALNPKPYG